MKRIKQIALGTAVALGVGISGLATTTIAQAEDSNYVPLLTYRTGPFAASGIHIANGMHDYLKMLNERDGGIGGIKIDFEECETGYSTEKGVECYEATKGEGSLVYIPQSTGITYQLIPKATADGIPVHSMGYGRTSAKNGNVFSHVFNYPANYWDGASGAVNYLLEANGNDISGKKIALVYHNSAYGKEPLRTLQGLADKHGFELMEVAVDHPGQEQKSQWLQIRRERPDFVLMWGWGVMNQVAIQEAANIRYPMENFIGIWWSGSENDVLPAGDAANGYKALTFHGVGSEFPVFDDIQKYVVDEGKSLSNPEEMQGVFYGRGLVMSMILAEGIAAAQAEYDTGVLPPAQLRWGLEILNYSEARLAELGLEGMVPPFSTSCADHTGHSGGWILEWDGSKFVKASDHITPDTSDYAELISEKAAEYAEANAPWPVNESCDAPS